MSAAVSKGLRAGSTFAVIILFLNLIGFDVIAATLIGKVFGSDPVGDAMPLVVFLGLWMALLGLWNGAYAARRDPNAQTETMSEALVSGLAAGLLAGLVTAIFAIIIGAVNDQGIELRTYLAAISPQSTAFLLFNAGTYAGAAIHFVLLLVTGIAGAALTFTWRHRRWGEKISKRTETARGGLSRLVERFRALPYSVYIVYGILAILLILMPNVWGSYWNYIIGTVGLYVIMGLGLNIIVGLAGQLVLGYVAFFAIGAYSIALLTAPTPHHLMWNFWPALLVGIILATLTGILLGLPILRLRGDYLAIVTLGFGEIIRIMIRSDILTPLTGGPSGVKDITLPSLFGIPLGSDTGMLYLILILMVLTIFITVRVQNSRTGRAWVAIREDEVAARATGINTFSSKLLALAIGAAFAGIAGVLFASRNQFTGPEDHSLMVSINVLALVIVGGMGSIPGIILGAFALKGLPEMLRELENYRLMVFGALLVVMMIWRPEGLWPASRPRLENTSPTAAQPEEEPGVTPKVEEAQDASRP